MNWLLFFCKFSTIPDFAGSIIVDTNQQLETPMTRKMDTLKNGDRIVLVK